MRLLTVAALAAVLAGCSSPEPSTDLPATSTAPAAESEQPSPTPDPPAPRANTTRDLAYSFEGRTWTTACVVAQPAVGECRHVQEGTNHTQPFPAARILRIQGTLTWSDGNEVVGIGLVWEEGGSIQADREFYAEGTSPLAFDWNVTRVADKGLAYHVASYVNAGPPEAHASASPGQDWRLHAMLTVADAEDAGT